MPNELSVGEARLGFIVGDGLEDTPPVAIHLSRASNRIRFELPWCREVNPFHDRWFMGDSASFGDDPERESHQYSVPANLLFADGFGSCALIGCSSAGFQSQLGSGIGVGRSDVDFVVLGARHAAYSELNGLRSEVEGLGTWMNLRSLTEQQTWVENRLGSATLTLESPQPVNLSRTMNLKIRPSYRYGRGGHPDETVITERMIVETRLVRTSRWSDHLRSHFAVRDIVRLAAWKPLNFLSHESLRDDDPIRTMDGQSHGDRWLSVATSRTDMAQEPALVARLDFMFHFDDVHSRGVNKWVSMYDESPRAVQPFLRLLDLKNASIETQIAQLGIGFDALGYLLATRSGTSRRKAKEIDFRDRLGLVLQEVSSVLPFDGNLWADDATKAYNAVKHANRTFPDPILAYLTLRASIQVFRAWVASRLGVSEILLRERLQYDYITQGLFQNKYRPGRID